MFVNASIAINELRPRSGPLVSVIVPVWNDAVHLERLLTRLACEPGAFETIAVDGGSTDDSVDAALRFPKVRLLHSARGRGMQMNAGAKAARGDVLLFLHCDTLPPCGAIARLPKLLSSANADFGAFRVRAEPRFLALQLLAQLTRLAKPWCCFGDQGIFVRRAFFERTGGFPEIPLLEDVHWLRAAARTGRMVRAPLTAVTSARRFARIGVARQLWRDFSILIRDRLGQDAGDLERIYSKGYSPAPGAQPARRMPPSPSPIPQAAAARPVSLAD